MHGGEPAAPAPCLAAVHEATPCVKRACGAGHCGGAANLVIAVLAPAAVAAAAAGAAAAVATSAAQITKFLAILAM